MATSRSQWYWDGAWHPYPKNKQPISIELLPIPEGFAEVDMSRIVQGMGIRVQTGGSAQNQPVFNGQGQRASTFKKTP